MTHINWNKFYKTHSGDEALKNSLIQIYLDDVYNRLLEVQKALSLKDFFQLELQFHSIKSSSAYVGAEEVEKLSRQLEHFAKNQDLVAIEPEIPRIQDLYQKACHELKIGDKNATESN